MYDFSDADDAVGFPVVPPGEYFAIIRDVNLEVNAANEKIVKIQWMITQGQFEGQMVFGNFMIESDSRERAVNVGRALLKKVCLATVLTPKVESLDSLKEKLHMITVRHSPKKDGGTPWVNVVNASPSKSNQTFNPNDLPF